jgi:hypothetical protein
MIPLQSRQKSDISASDGTPTNGAPPVWWTQLTQTMPQALRHLRVGIYSSAGAPFHHAALVALWGGYPIPVRAEDIRAGSLEGLDVLVFPGGGITAMAGMLTPLGVSGADAVRNWVAKGGMYLGSCAGSFLPSSVGEAYWNAHEEARRLHMTTASLANGSDSAFEGLTSPGVGTLEVMVSDRKHWLVEGLPDRFDMVHYNGPLFDLTAFPSTTGGNPLFAAPAGVLRPDVATTAFTRSEDFLGADTGVGSESVFDRCVTSGAHNGIAARYGDGLVVLFGSHPEFGFDPLQLSWGPAVKLFANALRHQAQRQHGSNQPSSRSVETASRHDVLCAALAEVSDALERIARGFGDLHDADTGLWLEPQNAPAFLGRSPTQLWSEATAAAARAAHESAALTRRLVNEAVDLRDAARWIDDLPLPNQDVGFMGLRQLVARIETSVEAAQRQLKEDPISLAHAYDGMTTHPYQIAVGSYLSAAGLTAAAVLTASTIAAIVGRSEWVPFEILLQPSTESTAA